MAKGQLGKQKAREAKLVKMVYAAALGHFIIIQING